MAVDVFVVTEFHQRETKEKLEKDVTDRRDQRVISQLTTR